MYECLLIWIYLDVTKLFAPVKWKWGLKLSGVIENKVAFFFFGQPDFVACENLNLPIRSDVSMQ